MFGNDLGQILEDLFVENDNSGLNELRILKRGFIINTFSCCTYNYACYND